MPILKIGKQRLVWSWTLDSATLGAFEMRHVGTKDTRAQSDQGGVSEPICGTATRKHQSRGEGERGPSCLLLISYQPRLTEI